MKYYVEVTFEVRGWRMIEAVTAEEAEEKARDMSLPSFRIESEELTDVTDVHVQEEV